LLVACVLTGPAEYLICGVPCVGSAGAGYMAEVIEGARVGVALNRLTPQHCAQGPRKSSRLRLKAACKIGAAWGRERLSAGQDVQSCAELRFRAAACG